MVISEDVLLIDVSINIGLFAASEIAVNFHTDNLSTKWAVMKMSID